jgi:hypothetical protein
MFKEKKKNIFLIMKKALKKGTVIYKIFRNTK